MPRLPCWQKAGGARESEGSLCVALGWFLSLSLSRDARAGLVLGPRGHHQCSTCGVVNDQRGSESKGVRGPGSRKLCRS